MTADAELALQKDLARHLRAGHPWVFRKAIERAPKDLAAGAIVDVTDGGRFVARGYFDPRSAISVRILTRDPAELAKARAINTACQRNGVRTIAESVETKETLDKLREIGIDYVQGFGIARPAPLATLLSG